MLGLEEVADTSRKATADLGRLGLLLLLLFLLVGKDELSQVIHGHDDVPFPPWRLQQEQPQAWLLRREPQKSR